MSNNDPRYLPLGWSTPMMQGPQSVNNPLPVYPGAKVGDSRDSQRNPLQTQKYIGPYYESDLFKLVWETVGVDNVAFRAKRKFPTFDLAPWLGSPAGQKTLQGVPIWADRGSGVNLKIQVQTMTSAKLDSLYMNYAEFGHIRDSEQIEIISPQIDCTQDLQGGAHAPYFIFEPPGYPYHIRFWTVLIQFEIRGISVATPPDLFICGGIY